MTDNQEKTQTRKFSIALDGLIIEGFFKNKTAMLRKLKDMGYSRSEVNDRARQLGLSIQFIKRCSIGNPDVALRKCLRCSERFLSVGIQNRLCGRCKTRK